MADRRTDRNSNIEPARLERKSSDRPSLDPQWMGRHDELWLSRRHPRTLPVGMVPGQHHRLHTSADVHFGLAEAVPARRQLVPDAAYPERSRRHAAPLGSPEAA